MRKPHAFRPFAWEPLEDRVVLSSGTPAAGALISAQDAPSTTIPVERQDPGGMAAHAANVALADSGKASDVVLFGDSITALYGATFLQDLSTWGSKDAPFHAANFGVGGDMIENLLWRLQNGELDGKPRLAVVMIGTNDIYRATPADTAAGINAVVQTIRSLSPQTQVLLLGILPRSTPSDPVRGEIEQVNSTISGLADEPDVHYLDLGSLFLDPDQSLPAALIEPDNLVHPTVSGRELLSDALLAPLDALLGFPAPDPTSYGGPVLADLPADQVIEANAAGYAPLALAPLVFDALDPHPTVTTDPPLGSVLPVGTTVVTFTAIDRYGHAASATSSVTVRPYQTPSFHDVPSDRTVEATGPAGAVINYVPPTAADSSDPSVGVVCVPPSGSTFPVGTTVVTFTATNSEGHRSTATFSVTVNPDVPPVLQGVPSDETVEATGPAGAVVNYVPPTAFDPSDPGAKVVCSPPSGSLFPFGTTIVACSAIDQGGNVTTATFRISVRDTTPPAFAPAPNLVVEATGPTGAVVDYAPPTATDLVDHDPVVTYSPPSGSTFPIGTTIVTCTATDGTGNVASRTFQVTVNDTPILHGGPAPILVEATGRAGAGALVAYAPPTASDAADPGIRVVSTPPSGSMFPVGTTVVTARATNLSGASASTSFTVTVVPRQTLTTVPALIQSAFARATALMSDGGPVRTRRGRRSMNLSYRRIALTPSNADLVAFMSRVDTNHDSQVSRKELSTFIVSQVDLNHNGKISLYEQARLQRDDPQAARFLFPGT